MSKYYIGAILKDKRDRYLYKVFDYKENRIGIKIISDHFGDIIDEKKAVQLYVMESYLDDFTRFVINWQEELDKV